MSTWSSLNDEIGEDEEKAKTFFRRMLSERALEELNDVLPALRRESKWLRILLRGSHFLASGSLLETPSLGAVSLVPLRGDQFSESIETPMGIFYLQKEKIHFISRAPQKKIEIFSDNQRVLSSTSVSEISLEKKLYHFVVDGEEIWVDLQDPQEESSELDQSR